MKELYYLNRFFIRYKKEFLLGILITIIARIFSLVMPVYIGKSVKAVEHFLLIEDAQISDIQQKLIQYILIIIGSALLSGFFTFLMRQTIIKASRYIEHDLKNEIFKKYETLSTSFYKENRTGDLMNRISEDVSKVRMYVGPAIMYTIQTVTLFSCVIPLMFYSSKTMAIYTLLPLPVLSIIIYKISSIIHKRSTAVQAFLSKLTTFSQETFSGISVIKAYALEKQLQQELEDLALEGKQKNMHLVKINAWFFPMMILLIGLSNLLVIYVGGKQYSSGGIDSTGVIVEFIIYILMLTWPVATIGWVTSIVQQAAASQKRINAFLQIEPQIQDSVKAKKIDLKSTIVFDKVSFTYANTKIEALKNISCTIAYGSTVAIIGKTGSGKSTFLELLTRLYDPTQGSISINNVAIKDIAQRHLRNSMGVVPQDAFLFSDTIANNIAFGKPNASQEQIISAAKKAAIHENIMSFKDGYQTILGERGITLSGGQKQRVSIARAFIKDPDFLVLDDCLSAVDSSTEKKILAQITGFKHKKTTIIVSHRVSAVKNADKIIVLEKGKIIEQGTHNELLKKGMYYKNLYQEQLSEKEL